MEFKEWLRADRNKVSKREAHIQEHGVDPKTGQTIRPLELTGQTRIRGGKNSRRRTARVWQPRTSEE